MYPVTLRIIDPSGERTETRLFARASGLPALGETRYFFEAGTNVPFRSPTSGFFPDLLAPAMRAGIDHRLSAGLAVSGRVEASDKRQLLELSGAYLRPNWRASATAGITAAGERAAALALSGTTARISWSLDARGVEGGEEFLVDPQRGLGRSYRQVTAFGGWSGRAVSLHTGLFWRKDLQGRSSWSIIPRFLWTIARGSGRLWQLDAFASIGRSEWTAHLGFRAALFGGRSSVNLFGGGEARRVQGATLLQPVARADWHRSLEIGMDSLALRAAVLHEVDRLSGQFGGDLSDSRFQLTADAMIEEALDASALFGRASTQFGYSDGRLAFGSGIFTGAGIIAEAPGAPRDARLAVRTGHASSRPFAGHGPIFVSTQPFSKSSIGINALGSGVTLDTRSETAIFYPGTVKRLVRTSKNTLVIFVRLTDLSGAPLARATVSTEAGAMEADKDGNIQAEIGAPKLVVRTATGRDCTVDLTGMDLSGPFQDLGVRVCR